jgi:hypothetical protein
MDFAPDANGGPNTWVVLQIIAVQLERTMGTITRVHRADDRDIDELKSGFTCWNPVWQKASAANAKNFIMRLMDEIHNATVSRNWRRKS